MSILGFSRREVYYRPVILTYVPTPAIFCLHFLFRRETKNKNHKFKSSFGKTFTMKFMDLVEILSNKEKIVEYLRHERILLTGLICACGRAMRTRVRAKNVDGFGFWCGTCRVERSLRVGSFIEGLRLPLSKIVAMLYLLNLDVLYKDISETLEISGKVVSDYAEGIRVSRSQDLERIGIKVGGEGVRVQVDETLIAKAKLARNMRARPVNEQWVLGFFDTSKGVGVMRLIPNRRQEVMLAYIADTCLPGTIIVSDGHASYQNLPAIGFRHEVVVHEHNFVDPENGVHTNRIENYWQRVKRRFKRIYGTSRRLLPLYLQEFMWFERFGKNLEEKWRCTMNIMAR